jgi:hypothetical protein
VPPAAAATTLRARLGTPIGPYTGGRDAGAALPERETPTALPSPP